MFEISEFIKNVIAWNLKNFGGHYGGGYRYVIGIQEELGELLEAYQDKNADKIRDAVGDVFTFLVNYCDSQNIELWNCKGGVYRNSNGDYLHSIISAIQINVGHLSHAHLKGDMCVRYTPKEVLRLKQEAIAGIYMHLVAFCLHQGIDFDRCLEEVWNVIKDRSYPEYSPVEPPPLHIILDREPRREFFEAMMKQRSSIDFKVIEVFRDTEPKSTEDAYRLKNFIESRLHYMLKYLTERKKLVSEKAA